jgi:hypothetical protein
MGQEFVSILQFQNFAINYYKASLPIAENFQISPRREAKERQSVATPIEAWLREMSRLWQLEHQFSLDFFASHCSYVPVSATFSFVPSNPLFYLDI